MPPYLKLPRPIPGDPGTWGPGEQGVEPPSIPRPTGQLSEARHIQLPPEIKVTKSGHPRPRPLATTPARPECPPESQLDRGWSEEHHIAEGQGPQWKGDKHRVGEGQRLPRGPRSRAQPHPSATSRPQD